MLPNDAMGGYFELELPASKDYLSPHATSSDLLGQLFRLRLKRPSFDGIAVKFQKLFVI